MCDIIQIDPEIMGGTPVFRGTRVPISTLFDYLSDSREKEDPVSDFLEQFPSVKPEQVADLLEYYSSKASSGRRIA